MVASSQLISLPLCQILSVFWMGIKTPYDSELQRGGVFLRQGTSRREPDPRYRPLYLRGFGLPALGRLPALGFGLSASDLRPQTSDLGLSIPSDLVFDFHVWSGRLARCR